MIQFDSAGFATADGKVKVYVTDENGLLLGEAMAQISAGTSLPAFSYMDPPPNFGEGEAVKRSSDGHQWVTVPDHRGKTVYAKDGSGKKDIVEVGEIPEECTLLRPLTVFDKWDGAKWVTNTEAEKAAQVVENTHRKAALIAEATAMIAPLQDAKDGGYIDDEDIPALTDWQKYRYALTKVDPANPSWPERPGQ